MLHFCGNHDWNLVVGCQKKIKGIGGKQLSEKKERKSYESEKEDLHRNLEENGRNPLSFFFSYPTPQKVKSTYSCQGHLWPFG